ncbi:arsenate reductase-like protein [Mycoavidus cysteinexigens]|uniref:Arsenate reductase-like protein n=1 Tax=Mycoavidus cysteinexigens TaxID=1553431 RepID=A0A2Z6EUW0_9BURK|nr:ArsC family reductase [Mycoavidus cysteinexigens]BBE09201.1 arsenate reductase-like protein [Mycoavidus cysteinexigens]GLR02154.1 arsenate reductase [Mycoavidus cysteinexigens]
MKVVMYGIPNCETVKKARLWLAARTIPYQFHDFKKVGVDRALLSSWLEDVALDLLLNRRGTTWRTLPDEVKVEALDQECMLKLMINSPSVIKRPVLVVDGRVQAVGFSEAAYDAFFAQS